MTTYEAGLLDTNVLVYAADQMSTFHQSAKTLRDLGLTGGVSLCVCAQVLNEFFAVITDPRRVSNPRSQEEARNEIEKYYHSENIAKIYTGPDILERMLELLERYEISRQEIFDLQLVATMVSNQVTRIYTYNRDHFAKFNEIEALTP